MRDVGNQEGKTACQRASCAVVHGRIQLRLLGDSLQSAANLIKKLVPHSTALPLVPSRRVLKILRGLDTDKKAARS